MSSLQSTSNHILALNDFPAMGDLIAELLKDEGYQATAMSYRTNDLPAIAAVSPDLIVLDVLTGSEAAGWRLVERLKGESGTREIPFVLCTAAIDSGEGMQRLFDPIGIWVVYKPFTFDDMLEAVEAAFDNVKPATPEEGSSISPDGSTDGIPDQE